MKLSTRGRYGMRAMFELALRWKDGPVMLRAIAESQHMSGKYLEQILTQLKNAGLIRVVRGAKGGFLLAREPAAIQLSDVLTALEGDICFVDCVTCPDVCDYAGTCTVRDLWVELSMAVRGILESYTLADLVKRSGTARPPADPRHAAVSKNTQSRT